MFLLEPWLGSFTDPLWDDEHVLNRVLKGLGYFADRDYACEDILVMAANADNNCDYGLFDDYDMEPFDVFLAMTLAARQINSEVENPHIVLTTPSTFFRMMEGNPGALHGCGLHAAWLRLWRNFRVSTR
jgi:hypothetical protein